jgi:hypothetical protein
MPDIPEDITTEEQVRRCRELLASNLCVQGVRAISDESLPQLIAKVLKIDRQQRHIETYKNYATTLKNFAIANQQDYAFFYVNSVGYDTSISTAGAKDLTSAYRYYNIPTTFSIGGVSTTVSSANVLLLYGIFGVDWGTASAAYYHTYTYFANSPSSLIDCRTFAEVKSRLGSVNSYSFKIYGTTMSSATSTYGTTYTGAITRYNDTHYCHYSTPYSTSYDFLGSSYLSNTVWIVKLPALGTSPNISFPADPVIPKQEFYY